MLGAVVENLIGGFLHPRASVRRLLAGGHGLDAAIAMVILAFLVREIFFILVPGVRPGDASFSVVHYALGLVDSLLTFGLFSLMVCYIGRMFGGKATFQETGLAVGWYLLVTSVIMPVVLPAVMSIVEAARAGEEVPGGAAMVVFAASGVMLWLLASYVAEVHRFERTWPVLLAILGVSILFSFLFSGLVPTV